MHRGMIPNDVLLAICNPDTLMLCAACPSDPDVPCWETQHIAFVVVALIGLCFYSICVPVVWMRVMQRATTSNRLRCLLLSLVVL